MEKTLSREATNARLFRFNINHQPPASTTVLRNSRSRTLVCIDWSPSFWSKTSSFASRTELRDPNLSMPVHLPSEVLGGSFVNRRGGRREVGGNMVFKAVLADITQQLLHLRNLNHSCPAERMQRVVGKCTLAYIAGDLSGEVVG